MLFGEESYQKLSGILNDKNYSIIFVLVDENTHEHCLPYFMGNLEGDFPFEIIEIVSGEINKTLETCSGVWEALSELGADRKSAMINLGGGVITDMGGFIASCFKRGIDFYNIPTTLLAMVDASVGGKTGVDLGLLKNQIGVIIEPEVVIVDQRYLTTLDQRQFKSGFAEMLKHGLISDANYWNQLKENFDTSSIIDAIQTSVQIKATVVQQDPRENGLRKILNFGHTIGHAIESYFLSLGKDKMLLHGEAIAIGMIMEAYLSTIYCQLEPEALKEISEIILHHFGWVEISEKDKKEAISLLKFDKKNSHGTIKYVLLEHIGSPVIDVQIKDNDLNDAFAYYHQLQPNH